MRVAVLSTHDWANSGWRIAESLKAVGVNAKCFTRKVCHFFEHRKFDIAEVSAFVRGSDAIIYKGDEGVINPFYKVPVVDCGIPIFCAFGGSSFLKKQAEVRERHSTIKMVKGMVALRPDLRFADMKYIPHPVDCDLWHPDKRTNGRTPKIIIGHYISNRGQSNLKGTEVVRKAVARLGGKAHFDFCVNVPYDSMVAVKRMCDIYVESIGFRYYGNNGAESMALGIPTIAEIPKLVFDMNPGFDPKGVINANANNLQRKLQSLFDPERRKIWSERARKWAVDFHSYQAVGKMWKDYIIERSL